MNTEFRYETDWTGYAYPDTNTITRTEEMKKRLTEIKLKTEDYNASGIPIIVENGKAYLNNATENSIIFGETGCKKSRCLIAPLITMIAGARESAFITDVKGELYGNSGLRGFIEAKGIKTVCLDFRNFDKDSYNILAPAYDLYKNGNRSEASSLIHRFVDSLGARYRDSKADPFWDTNASQSIEAMTMFLFEICSNSRYGNYDEYVNILTVANLLTENSIERLKVIIDEYLSAVDNNIMIILKNLVNMPDRTLSCVLSTISGFLKDLLIQEKLMNMLSVSSFDIDKMYEEPTFVFFIIPDETSAYDSIAGLLMDTFYSRLIEIYSNRYQSRKEASCRINYVCDEFCNLRIGNMNSKISACRSRNIRWFIVCQSKSQLEKVYPNDYPTIIGNCKNTFFLQSSDLTLLQYISDLCGKTYISENGTRENLISEDILRKLEKCYEYKEVLYIRDNTKYFGIFPDIEGYIFLENYNAEEAKSVVYEKVHTYDMYRLEQDLEFKRIRFPYSTI